MAGKSTPVSETKPDDLFPATPLGPVEISVGGVWRISLLRRSELTLCESRGTITSTTKKTACRPAFVLGRRGARAGREARTHRRE